MHAAPKEEASSDNELACCADLAVSPTFRNSVDRTVRNSVEGENARVYRPVYKHETIDFLHGHIDYSLFCL
jgi:hypothetical protein